MNLKGILKDKSDSLKLFYFFLIVTISSFVGILISSIISPTEIDSLLNENIFRLKMSQLIASLFIFIVPSVVLSYFTFNESLNIFGFKRGLKRQNIQIILLIMIFIQPFVIFCVQINSSILESISEYIPVIYKQMKIMEDRATELTEFLLQMNTTGDLFFNIFLIALIPAIGEELFFRGIIQQKLENILAPHLSVFITSFIFSAIHFQFFGFLPRLFLGMILGYLFLYSRNLWASIFAHFINNAMGVLLMYSSFKDNLSFDITEIPNIEVSPLQGLFSILVVFFFIFLYRKINMDKII